MTRVNRSIILTTRIAFLLIVLLAGHHLVMAAAALNTDHPIGQVEECRIGDGQVQSSNPSPAPPAIPADLAAGLPGCWALHQPQIHNQTAVSSVSLPMLQVFLN